MSRALAASTTLMHAFVDEFTQSPRAVLREPLLYGGFLTRARMSERATASEANGQRHRGIHGCVQARAVARVGGVANGMLKPAGDFVGLALQSCQREASAVMD